jgi:hypothetical protein
MMGNNVQTGRFSGVIGSTAVKPPCVTAATVPITLYGLYTLNNVALGDGSRVLVMGQADNTKNGVYEARSVDWDRAGDFDGNRDAINGTMVIVNDAPDAPVVPLPPSVVFYAITLAEQAAGLDYGTVAGTVLNTEFQSDAYDFIDIRRYGGGPTATKAENDAALLTAVAVIDEVDGHRIFFPSGSSEISSDVHQFTRHTTLFGVSGSGSNGKENAGSVIYCADTTGDVLVFGDNNTSAHNCGIENLYVKTLTTGLSVFLNKAPFFSMYNAYIDNSGIGGRGMLGRGSHHFSAINSHFLKDPFSQQDVGGNDGIGVQFVSDGSIAGIMDFWNCRFLGWQTGLELGQFSVNAFDWTARDYTGTNNYPAIFRSAKAMAAPVTPGDHVNFNLFGCQFKSCSVGAKFGLGANAGTITGCYTEGGNTADLLFGYGAANITVKGNMFNGGTSSKDCILVGQGGVTERKDFWNIRIEGNWFRTLGQKIVDGVPGGVYSHGIKVTGNGSDWSLVKIRDNDFEITDVNSVGITVSGSGSDRTYIVEDNTFVEAYDPETGLQVTGATYCTGISATQRPIEWVNTPMSATVPKANWSNIEELTGARALTIADDDVLTFTCDSNHRNVDLPPPEEAINKSFIVTNFDTAWTLVIRDPTLTYNLATLAVMDTGLTPLPNTVDRVRCFCDGTYWTVEHDVDINITVVSA